ncbi:hypothetical protein [Streptomyces rapamycinicus]|uniref:hypothetical protein n=1 Tax=Streptomyces rapamycinicus TaxID=1226757 RepID=UPI001AD7F74C|nr:hypothetical protein [Streptomyces rapamycinicus]
MLSASLVPDLLACGLSCLFCTDACTNDRSDTANDCSRETYCPGDDRFPPLPHTDTLSWPQPMTDLTPHQLASIGSGALWQRQQRDQKLPNVVVK